jgi:hypothetical protein
LFDHRRRRLGPAAIDRSPDAIDGSILKRDTNIMYAVSYIPIPTLHIESVLVFF